MVDWRQLYDAMIATHWAWHKWAFCGERKMPWKVCKPMDERLKFIARLLDGEEFGISRKTATRSSHAITQ